VTAPAPGSDDFADERPTAPAQDVPAPEAGAGTPQGEAQVHAEQVQAVDAEAAAADPTDGTGGPADPFPGDALNDAALALAADLRSDLQRLQAEYVNYRKRVERDRSVARDTAIAGVLEGLLPVLDDIELARQHGDLESGPFAAISEKLESVLGRFGLARYGSAGEEFDPSVHEALMLAHSDEVQTSTVTQVLQPGYTLGDKVLRAARVAVTDPQ